MSPTAASNVGSSSDALHSSECVVSGDALAYANQTRVSTSGIWVGVFATTMTFAALTSALFVREGTTDWTHLTLPGIFYLNTLALLAGSATFEKARRVLLAESGTRKGSRKAGIWVLVTSLLGIAFCTGQVRVWQELRAERIYLATSPNSSFFYLLTFLHAMIVAVGILVLIYIAGRLSAGQGAIRRSLFDSMAIYWHFMTVLWVYLLLLCRMKL